MMKPITSSFLVSLPMAFAGVLPLTLPHTMPAASACPRGLEALATAERLVQADSLLQALTAVERETSASGRDAPCAADRADLFYLAASLHNAIGDWGAAAVAYEQSMLAHPRAPGLAATWMSYYGVVHQSGDWEHLIEVADRLHSDDGIAAADRARIGHDRALGLWELGRDREAVEAFRRLGFADAWAVIGGFSSDGGSGLDRTFGPESDPCAERAHSDEGQVERRWRRLAFPNPWVDFSNLYGETNRVFYALTFARVPRAGSVRLSLGVAGAIRIWVDGRPVLRDPAVRVLHDALYECDVELQPGWHAVLCKVDCSDSRNGAGVALRLADAEGRPLEGVEWSHRAPDEAGAAAADLEAERWPGAVEWPLYARARQHYAANPRLTRAIELLQMADWGDYESEALSAYPAIADSHGRSVLVLRELWPLASVEERDLARNLAQEIRTRSQDVFIDFAADNSEETSADARRASLAGFVARHPASVPPRLALVSSLLQSEDLPAVEAHVDTLARLVPTSPFVAMTQAALLENKMQPARARAALEAAYARARGNLQAVRLLVQSYTKAGDTSAILELLRGIQEREPACEWPHTVEATVRLRAELPALAAEAIQRAMEVAPDDAQVLEVAGNIAEARRENRQAQDLYARALALDPDLWDVRERLRKLRGEPEWTTWFAKETTEDLVAADRARPHAPEAHAYYVLNDCNYLMFEDGAARVSYRAVGRVNDADGVERFKQQSFLQPSNMILGIPERLVTLKPDGRMLHGESKDSEFSLANLEPGDYFEVRYSYWVSSTTPLGRGGWENHWLADDTRRRVARFQLVRPRGRALTTRAGSGVEAATDTLAGGRTRTTWTSHDVPEVLTATEASWKAINDYLVDFTTVGSWNEVGAWYERQTYRRRSAAEVTHKAEQIVAGATSKMGEALALSQYVVSEVAYSPASFLDRAYQPNSDRDILRRGFGDCKDQCTLLLALARSRGIDGASALADAQLDREYPYLPAMRFDHVVAVLRVDGKEIWVDPTESIHPSRIPVWLQGREVLLVDKDGSRLVKVPEEEPERTVLQLETHLAIEPSGKAVQESRILETGGMAAGTFVVMSNLEPEDWPEPMQKWFAPQVGSMHVGEVDYPAPKMVTDSIAYGFRAERTLGVTPFGGRSLLSGLFQTAWSNADLIAAADRKSPLEVEHLRRRIRETVSVDFPEALEPEELPRPEVFEIPEARYSLSVQRQGTRRVVLERDLVVRVFEVEAERLAAFRDFLSRVEESDRALVGLRGAVASR